MLTLTNDMISLYEKKVLFIANKYSNNYNRQDLISAGKLGLIKASKKYDESLEIKFSTFCEKYILGEILDYIRKDKSIRVSKDFIKLKRKVDIATNEYYSLKNKYPDVEELSYILKEDKEKIIEVLSLNQNVKSLDDKINNDNENLCIKDIVSEDKKVDTIDLICLNDALNQLNTNDRNLIKERYYNGKTQTEIANEMNISQVKVYRMERKILDDLNSKLYVA